MLYIPQGLLGDNAWSALGYTVHYSGVCCVCCVCCISPKDCFCCVCGISPKDCVGIMPGALWGTLAATPAKPADPTPSIFDVDETHLKSLSRPSWSSEGALDSACNRFRLCLATPSGVSFLGSDASDKSPHKVGSALLHRLLSDDHNWHSSCHLVFCLDHPISLLRYALLSLCVYLEALESFVAIGKGTKHDVIACVPLDAVLPQW